MFAVDCQICKDSLGGPDKLPAAMPCGHLYCLDCATFWFNSGEDRKCFCGKSFTGDQVIRLWTSDDGNGHNRSDDTDADREREELAAACRADIMDDDVDMNTGEGSLNVLHALQRVQSYVEAFAGSPDVNDIGSKNLLADVRYTLSSIKTALEEKTNHSSSLAKENLQSIHQTLQRVSALLDQERADHQSTIFQYDRRVNTLIREKELLGVRLQEYKRKARGLHDMNVDLERQNVELKSRVDALTHSALKSKKKYYALKQSLAQKSSKGRSTGTKPDDDSIIILD